MDSRVELDYPENNEKNFETWEKFVDELERIKLFREQEKRKTSSYVSDLIYRGQANSQWKLETTLERFTRENKYEVKNYYKKIHRASYEIEAFTKEKWNIPSHPTYNDLIKDLKTFGPHKQLFSSDYELSTYFLYLRHHGFPSPLLDWTRSPFIAAYFAYNDQHDTTEYVSIYVFLEQIGIKTGVGGAPTINTLGPTIKSHERHFLQQCEYTFCLKTESGNPFFSNHEEIFSTRRPFQQFIWKCNIRTEERKKVLAFLDSVNINAFSLFQSSESLMATAATRYFFLEE